MCTYQCKYLQQAQALVRPVHGCFSHVVITSCLSQELQQISVQILPPGTRNAQLPRSYIWSCPGIDHRIPSHEITNPSGLSLQPFPRTLL